MLLSSGAHLSSVSQQRAKYITQMEYLLNDLGTAVKSVTYLELRINTTRFPKREKDRRATQMQAGSSGPPPLPSKMFELLRQAVPTLQHLSLRGDYHSRVTLATFEPFSRQLLKELQMEVGLFDNKSLQTIHEVFPGISHLTFKQYSDDWREHEPDDFIYSFLDTAHLDLSKCTSLTTLEIDGGAWWDDTCIDFPGNDQFWKRLPTGITDLRCNTRFNQILSSWDSPRDPDCANLMDRLQHLTLSNIARSTLQLVLKGSPRLERLTLSGTAYMELMTDPAMSSEDLSSYKDHMLNGFQVSSPQVMITGSGEAIRDNMGWVPPLLDTTQCALFFPGAVHADCLGQVVRLFPSLVKLNLYDDSKWADTPLMGEEFLNPLMGCRYMEDVEICVHLKYTHTGLVALCSSLPSLRKLRCQPCTGIRYARVATSLKAAGRNVLITELKHTDVHRVGDF